MKPFRKYRKKLIDEIIKSLKEDSDKWVFDQYITTNKTLKISLWLANGFFFLGIHQPVEVKFSLWEKLRVHRAINQCRVLNLLKVLSINQFPGITVNQTKEP